ncbi:MAG: sigma-70 family RNA polymerase sigma factor [Burkholderiaceae bacterium]|nr:sigma-70 family RNA polymerase sigma factor [Burkholderiaceae bacterium]
MDNASIDDIHPLNRFLKMAVLAGVESAIQIHIKRGDDLNARDRNGLTLLMLSAARNKSDMCKLLLDAGADKNLLDPSGNTARAIAVAAGAHAAATVLESVSAVIEDVDSSVNRVSRPCCEPNVPLGDHTSECLTYLNSANNTKSDLGLPIAQVTAIYASDPENMPDFDLSGWEPEEDCPPPEADTSVAQAANAIQTAISVYEPIDSSEDWGDIDAYLPERSLPLVRTDDAEARERLRLLLLRAIREGSVPSMEVESLSLNDDRSANLEAEALLIMVVNDLGAEVDERFEYISTNENFEVFVSPEETQDEEEIVADAMTFVDSLASRRTEPLRIYQKEFQRERLISAEEEVSISQAMEIGIERALDALAAWPRGINVTLAAGHLVKTRQRPMTWLSPGPVEAQPNLGPALEAESETDTIVLDQTDEEIEPNDSLQFDAPPTLGDHTSDFLGALDRLASLTSSSIMQDTDLLAVRETLTSLRLNRRFLLELAYIKDCDDSHSAVQYTKAMEAYQCARERMTAANLKLVFHLAKKYLFSGEPLDDLAQEGNIGLLKAVDRFDWRRGFKFSTYATWWIRQQIGRHVADKGRTIRIPVHLYEKVQRHSRETQAFELETGRMPEVDEIAARLDMSARAVTALKNLAPEPLPLHDLLIDEQIAVDARSDFVSPDPFDIVSESDLRRTVDTVLSTLKPKEEQIVRLRYGIGINDALTLEDVGQRYELTRERIRQIEANAIRKLKQPSRIDALSCAFFGGPFSKERKGEEGGSKHDDTEQSQEVNPTQHVVETESTPGSLYTPMLTKSTSIDRLLTQAINLGIPVKDDRDGTSGRIWVIFNEENDNRYRQFKRKLLALGFEFWPGKGYWK